jgi:hypothetical protein
VSTVNEELTPHFINILDWAGKAMVVLAAIKTFLVAVYQPWKKWRREHDAKTIREVLAPELAQLRTIIDDESGCAGRMTDVLTQMRAIFGDLDMFLEVAADNRERLDETNELLDAVGFNADRRVDEVQRDRIAKTMADLTERRRKRRRALLILSDNAEVKGD